MMITIRHILLIVTLFVSVNAFGATAEDILDSATQKYQSAKSLTATFTVTESGNAVNGTIIVSGDRFNVTTPEMSIWYDGRTQWTYSASTQEVNITEPTAEELQQVNPFAIINSFRNAYNATIIKSESGKHVLQLSPRSSQYPNIRRVILTLSSNTLLPSEIKISTENNSEITIKTDHIAVGKALPASTFTFDGKKFPQAEIIDLR